MSLINWLINWLIHCHRRRQFIHGIGGTDCPDVEQYARTKANVRIEQSGSERDNNDGADLSQQWGEKLSDRARASMEQNEDMRFSVPDDNTLWWQLT